MKKLTKLVSRYDTKTNEWEYLEIVYVKDLMRLGLENSELSKINNRSIATTVVKSNGEEKNMDVIPISSLENILKMEL